MTDAMIGDMLVPRKERFDGRPTAAPATFPYAGHRTMAEVMRDEEVEYRRIMLQSAVASRRKRAA